MSGVGIYQDFDRTTTCALFTTHFFLVTFIVKFSPITLEDIWLLSSVVVQLYVICKSLHFVRSEIIHTRSATKYAGTLI